MWIQRKRSSKNTSIVLVMIAALVGIGCVGHPLVPDEMRGKTFAVYPASIALTVNKTKEFTELLKDVSIFVVTAVATGGYAVVTPKPGENVADGTLGPALMHELAIRFEREFGVRKVADLKPLGSSKSTGGILTKAEIKSDYQSVVDYLVQFDSKPSVLSEGTRGNYTLRYFVFVYVNDAKTGQQLDFAGCYGVHGAAPLGDWFKDNGKILGVVTQEIASKCADEMISKLNKGNKS